MDPGTAVSVVDLNRKNPRTAGKLTQREAIRHMEAYGGNQAIDWVMDCVRYTADTVANADYHFEKKAPPRGTRVPGDALDPPEPLANLLDQPNPHMDYIEMLELLVMDLLLVGNAYWFKWRTNNAGQPLAIYRLAPPLVKVKPEPWGVGGYEYEVPGMDKLTIDDPSQVIHFKLANPHDPYYGLGLVQGAGRAADLELALADTQASYFENHAMPSMAVQSERRVPRDVFKKIRAQLRARTQGSRNAGELLVLEAGLKVASTAPSAAQAGFGEITRMSRDRIFAWFRMSPKLLGMMDEAGGADKTSDFQRIFDTKTARPLMNKLQKKISRELVNAWDLNYAIDYEYQMAPEDMARLAASYATIPGVTVDDVRKFAGLGPHPDKTIGSTTLNLPGADAGTGQPGDPTRQGFPDANLPGEAGRPPNFSNTKPFPRAGSPMPPNAQAVRGKALDLDAVLTRLDVLAIGEQVPEGKASTPPLPNEQRPDPLADRRTADIDAIVADLEHDLAQAARTLERSLLDHVEGKALNRSNIVQRIRNSSAWQAFTDMADQALQRGVRRALSTAAIHHGDLGLTPDDEIDYDGLVKELVHAKDTGVRAVTRTLKNSVAKAVKEQRDAGGNREELLAAVQGVMSSWVGSQAETIALTEATRGYNEGTLAVAEATGATHVLVSDGEDHDEPCKAADGQTWDLAQAHDNILEHPRCRRAFVPVTA